MGDFKVAASNSGINSVASDAERQAIIAVVQIWLTRLSLVSGITTFFASIDSLLFSLSSTSTHATTHIWSATDTLTTASFAGALIFHVCSAIVAFVASFVLVGLQLTEAAEQEERVLSFIHSADSGPSVGPSRGHRPSASLSATLAARPRESSELEFADALESALGRVIVRLRHPLGFFKGRRAAQQRALSTLSTTETLEATVKLLSRCHTLAIVMAVLGFILAVVGILAYAWTAAPLSVSVFSTACLGSCLLASVIVMW